MARPLRLVFVSAALLAALPADAETLAILPHAALHARPPPRFVAGSQGTLAHAIAEQEKRIRWKRPQSEGTIPARDPEKTCPKEMANVDARFCVDRWEGTLEEVAEDGRARPWPATVALDPAKRYRAVSAPGVVPQGYISGEQAEAACGAAGKRLCQASEWRLACAGSDGTTYPYGPVHVERRCNDYGHAPMYVFYPDVQRSWAVVTNEEMNDPRLNQMEGTVARTGDHAACVNNWGLYDMVGNLHEWTADPNGTFQGGYYLDTRVNGEGCAYRTTAHGFEYHDYSTGFRCCADLQPVDDDE